MKQALMIRRGDSLTADIAGGNAGSLPSGIIKCKEIPAGSTNLYR